MKISAYLAIEQANRANEKAYNESLNKLIKLTQSLRSFTANKIEPNTEHWLKEAEEFVRNAPKFNNAEIILD